MATGNVKNNVVVLVVVAGFILVVGMGLKLVTDNFRRATAQFAFTDLIEAVENLEAKGRTIPDVGSRDFKTDSPEGLLFLAELTNEETGAAGFRLEEATRGKSGAVYSKEGELLGWLDPWGRPYRVVIADGKAAEFEWGGALLKVEGRKIQVMSMGSDGREGTSDDAKTWN